MGVNQSVVGESSNQVNKSWVNKEAVTQGLIAAKYRLAKKSLMIPRLELMSGHMSVNLSTNVQAALEGFNMIEDKQCWAGK